ncbi:MAG: flagellar basal body-associated FliL family protein [Agarilytica sp.]
MQKFRFLIFLKRALLVCALVLSHAVFSEEEEEAAAEGEGGEGEAVAEAQAIYLPLKPPFVINYGGAGRLRFLKTEVSVRVTTIDAANAVRSHMPFVRNNLLMLFASQTNQTVGSQEGKQQIRVDALEAIRDIVEREEQTPREDIVEVFFNNFIVQK